MKDRIPTYAGRIRLTPVENQPNVYDTERADEPIQEGTPLNSQNLLSNATAQMFGLDEDSTPNDAFVATSNLIKSGAKIAMGSYAGTGNPNTNKTAEKILTFDFTPKILFIQQVGDNYTDENNITSQRVGHGGVFLFGCGRQRVMVYTSLYYSVGAGWSENQIRLYGYDDDRTNAYAVFNGETRNYIYVAIG